MDKILENSIINADQEQSFILYRCITNMARMLNRKKRKRGHFNFVYYEDHHILPRCLGGDTLKSNMVLLTAKEHFQVHFLLTKMHPNNSNLVYAWNNMCRISSNQEERYTNAYLFKLAGERHAIEVSKKKMSGKNHPNYGGALNLSGENHYNYGNKLTQETKDKISESMQGKEHKKGSEHPNYGNKHTPESIAKMAENMKGLNNPNYGKRGTETSMYGKKHSLETIKEMKRKATTGYICEWCKKESGKSVYSRFHGDRCKCKEVQR